jgi:hypothetical protein
MYTSTTQRRALPIADGKHYRERFGQAQPPGTVRCVNARPVHSPQFDHAVERPTGAMSGRARSTVHDPGSMPFSIMARHPLRTRATQEHLESTMDGF